MQIIGAGLCKALLGAFAELQNATFSFALSVHPSVSPHGTTRLPLDGFVMKFDISVFFENF